MNFYAGLTASFDRPPPKSADMDALERLCARNEQIVSGHTHVDLAFRRHFAKWHSPDLISHIKELYRDAAADGFLRWK